MVELVDVGDPRMVMLDGVHGQRQHLRVSLGELFLELRDAAQLGGADGSEVLRMAEENAPAAAEVVVEMDGAQLRLCGEVRRGVAEAEDVLGLEQLLHFGTERGSGHSEERRSLSKERSATVERVEESECTERSGGVEEDGDNDGEQSAPAVSCVSSRSSSSDGDVP